MFEIVSVN